MATVFIPSLLRHLTHGQETIQVPGTSVGQIIDHLDTQFPGIKDRLVQGGELRPGVAVAVDSQLAHKGLRQAVPEECEIHFVPAISGGSPSVPGSAWDRTVREAPPRSAE